MKQNKIDSGSMSVIKTMEYMIQNNWNQFKSTNDQARVLNSFFEMVNLKVVDSDP